MAAEQVTEYEYQMVCAQYGKRGHEFHHFKKYSFDSVESSVSDRNHQGELDAKRPVNERYMDHNCVPYKGQVRPVSEWADTNPRSGNSDLIGDRHYDN